MLVASLCQAWISTAIVREDHRPCSDSVFDKPAKDLGAPVSNNGESHSSGIAASFVLVQGGPRFAMTHLNGTGNKNFVVDAAAFSSRPPSDQGFVYFDVLIGMPADAILVRPHHSRAEFMKNAESRLIAGQPKLALKLHGRYPRCLTGYQISSPEPNAQGRVTTFHDGAHY